MRKKIILYLVAIFFIAPCFAVEIKTTPNDKRKLEYVELDNGLKVIAISDKTAMPSALVSVGVGSFSDPKEHQGLAHLLEHMLFLKNKENIQSNRFQSFVAEHGGYTNAATEPHRTIYHYTISKDFLDESMSEFSKFFTPRSFDIEMIKKEINAVSSEHELYKTETGASLFEAIKLLYPENHPLRKDLCGNNKTLLNQSIDHEDAFAELSNALEHLHSTYYGADSMCLGIIGPQSTNDLINIVKKYFSGVQRAKKKFDYDNLESYKAKHSDLMPFITIKPSKEVYQYALKWAIDFKDLNYAKINALEYLINQTNRKDSLSLDSFLRQKYGLIGFGVYVDARPCLSGLTYSFQTGKEIDERTMKDLFSEVYQFTKTALSSIDETALRIQEEEAKRNFNHASPGASIETLQYLFDELKYSSPENLLIAPYENSKVSSPRNFEFLKERLKAENFFIKSINSNMKEDGNLKKDIFGTSYKIEYIANNFLESKENTEYKYQHVADTQSYSKNHEVAHVPNMVRPELVLKNTRSENYFWSNSSYNQPRIFLDAKFSIKYDVSDHPKKELLAFMMNKEISMLESDLLGSGFNFLVGFENNNFVISCSGYQDNFNELFRKFILKLKDISLQKNMFDNMYSYFKKSLYNSVTQDAKDALLSYQNHILKHENVSSPEEYVALLDGISLEDIQALYNDLFKLGYLKMFVGGNIDTIDPKEFVENIHRDFEQVFHWNDQKFTYKRKELTFPIQKQFLINSAQSGLTTLSLIPKASLSKEEWIIRSSLLEAYLSDRFFEELRTNQQLGYIASLSSRYYENSDEVFLKTLIVSEHKGSDELLMKTRKFFQDEKSNLENLSEDRFAQMKKSLKDNLVLEDSNLSAAYDRFYSIIFRNTIDWQIKEKRLDALEKTTLKDVIELYSQTIANKEEPFELVLKAQPKQHLDKIDSDSKNEKQLEILNESAG